MTAIILAAGMGSRLVPITETRPKCMVKVAGKPILQYQIEAYRDAGVTKIVVVCGYFSTRIKAFVARYGKLVECLCNEDYEVTNNMYSLYLALAKLAPKQPVMISNGDVVFEPAIIQGILAQPGSLIAVDAGSYDEESMKITVADGHVRSISKAVTADDAFGNSIDVYKFEGGFLAEFKQLLSDTIEVEGNRNDWTEVAIEKCLAQNPSSVRPYEICGKKWVEVDNYHDLQLADEVFSTLKLEAIDLFFIDLDGTIFLGDKVIEGAPAFIRSLQDTGREFKLLSNNSSKSKQEYVGLLSGYGIEVDTNAIVLSSDGAIAHIKAMGHERVFVLGTESLRMSVEDAGLSTNDRNYDCVLVGYDTELSYQKLKQAALLLHGGCGFFATHGDMVCPTVDGPIPDIGSILALLEKATGRAPDKTFGKPDKQMVQFLLEEKQLNPSFVASTGAGIYTDMLAARNVGSPFILVLSGETKRDEVDQIADFPDLIVQSVASLF